MLTNVKLFLNSLTTIGQLRPTSHPTLTQLSLFRFREKFVTLPTLKWVFFTLSYTFLSIVSLNLIVMAKQTSLFGKISGKIGSVVFSTSGGETISREYNPHVANPSTQAQVNQRARMKLMSQLSAALAPVIAIPKQGLVSSRNAFTKLNFGASYATNGTAQITYENVQLTNGNAGLPSIVATRAQESGITIQLAENASNAVDRVVYILYRKTSEQTLQLVQSIVVESAGVSGTFIGSMVYTEGDLVFYAYGMKDLNANASAAYGNMAVANAVDVARLVATRKVDSSSYQFTQTRGATMYADENEIADVPEGSARVFVAAFPGGNVSGGGVYEIGQNATVVATPSEGYTFVGWRVNGTAEIVSTDASYTFEVEGLTDLVAFFQPVIPGSTYTINVRTEGSTPSSSTKIKINDREYASSDSITIQAGDSITIEASDNGIADIEFSGWYDRTNNTGLSSANPYTFVPNGNVEILSSWRSGSM